MTTVRYFHNGTAGVGGMAGAPTLNGTAGSMIAVLDACLVAGWGSGTVDSVVISGGIATVTRAAGHPFDVDCVAELAGATVTGGTINGAQKVLTVAGTTYTFATALANQTATGTITHKVASLGWAKAFSGTNLAAYRPADTAGTRMFLRVDDAAANSSRVIGYESMSDISSGLTNPFPSEAQSAGGGWWAKSDVASSASRDWVLLGDSRGFYLWVRHGLGGSARAVAGFGDYQSNKPANAFACLIGCAVGAYPGSTTPNDLSTINPNANSGPSFQPRGVSGIGQSSQLSRNAMLPLGSHNGSSSGAVGPVFPNPAANEVLASPILLSEHSPLASAARSQARTSAQ